MWGQPQPPPQPRPRQASTASSPSSGFDELQHAGPSSASSSSPANRNPHPTFPAQANANSLTNSNGNGNGNVNHQGPSQPNPQTSASPSKSDGPQRSPVDSSQTRTRSSRACTHCSQRKAKCDGVQPCSTCVRGGHTCVFTTPRKRGPPKGAPARGGIKKRSLTNPAFPVAPLPPQPPSSHPHTVTAPASAPIPSSRPADIPSVPSQRLARPDELASLSAPSPSSTDMRLMRIKPESGDEMDQRQNIYQAHRYLPPLQAPPSHPSPSRWESSWRPPPIQGRQYNYNAGLESAEGEFNARHEVKSPNGSYLVQDNRQPPMDAHQRSTLGTFNHHPLSGDNRYSYQLGSDAGIPGMAARSHPESNARVSFDSQMRTQPHSDRVQGSNGASGGIGSPTSRFNFSGPTHSRDYGLSARMSISSASSPPGVGRIATTPTLRHSAYGETGNTPTNTSSWGYQSNTMTGATNNNQASTSRFGSSTGRHTGGDSVLPGSTHNGSSSDRSHHDHTPGTSFWPSTAEPPPSTLSPPSPADNTVADSSPLTSDPNYKAEEYLPGEVIQRLLDIYQAFVHPHWPIIYMPSITSLRSLQETTPILFEAILAVSSATFDSHRDASDTDPAPSTTLDLYFGQSKQTLQSAWSSGELSAHFANRVKARILNGQFSRSISTIQAAILVSVVEMGSGNNSSSWHYGGIACRIALDMNLHRESARSTGKPRSNAEIQERRRVLWACFILDKILCSVLEKPVGLHLGQIETEKPSIYERDEFDIWLNENTQPFVPDRWLGSMVDVKVHAMSSFIAWTEVMAILENILNQVYSPEARRERCRTNGESLTTVINNIEESLHRWKSSLPPNLQWEQPPQPNIATGTGAGLGAGGEAETTEDDATMANENAGGSISCSASGTGASTKEEDSPGSAVHRGVAPQVLTMRGWYCICLILLHRPGVPQLLKPLKERRGSEEGSALEICAAAAREVCDVLHVYDTTFRIRKIPSSWVYLVFQSATIHSALASLNRSTGDGYLAQCLRFLSRIGRTWKSASHHVQTLESLCVSSAQNQTRPVSPVDMRPATPPAEVDVLNIAQNAQFWDLMPFSSEDEGSWHDFIKSLVPSSDAGLATVLGLPVTAS